MTSTAVWGPTDVGPDHETDRVLGSLTLRVRRLKDEVWVHGASEAAGPPEPDAWARWSLHEDDRLELRPTLPDRIVVVSPEQPFHLLPRVTARVFVRVPLFVSLVRMSRSETETELISFPSLVLSDTWWGSLTEGEVAYWLTTKARRSAPPEIFEPHLAVCPLSLQNASDSALPVERFAVRGAHLTLFRKKAALWTDEVQVRYEGAQEGSEVRYTGEVPADVRGAERVAPPREPPPKSFHARTFNRLLAISGL